MDWLEVLTGVLVAITGFYALATFQILRANQQAVAVMREQTEALARPYLAIAPFVPERGFLFYLRIANTGKTPAEDLRLSIDRDFYQYGEAQPEKNLAGMPAFNEPIDSLPPGAELIFGLAQGPQLFGEGANEDTTPSRFEITAEYSFAGKTVTEKTHVDLRPYYGAMPGPSVWIEELQKIRKALEKAAS